MEMGIVGVGKNIKKLREMYGLTQEALAEIAGVTNKAVSAWESGTKEPRMGAIERIAKHFGLKKSNLIEENGLENIYLDATEGKKYIPSKISIPVPKSVEVPLYGSIAAGVPLEMIEIEECIDIPETIGDKYPDAFLLRVNGDSMNKVVPNGMYALIAPHEEIRNGDIVAINVNGFEATLKRFFRNYNTVTLEPDSYNPEHRPRTLDCTKGECEDIKILGKMVWFMSPFNMKY